MYNREKMKSFLNDKKLILILLLVAFFVYVWRLQESLLFVEDTARDTLAMLKLWQQKEITLIGPPISFGQYGIRTMFFGSLAYYIGLTGLLISSFNPLGAIYPNVLFFLMSIPVFYLFIKQLTPDRSINYGATVLYALSPITVYHARFFWNPNLIIPLSVLFWYLVLKKKSKNNFLRFFAAGIVGGLMTNLHYVSLLPALAYSLFLFWQKKIKPGFSLLAGFIVSSLPLILFELKNNFYLLKAASYNIQHPTIQKTANLDMLSHFFDSIWILSGLKHAEFPFPTFPVSYPFIFIVLSLLLIFLFAGAFKKGIFKGKTFLLALLLVLNIIAVKLSSGEFHMRYLFPVYPLLVWFVGTLFFNKNIKNLGFIIFLSLIFTTYLIVQDTPSINKNYLPLKKTTAISSYIVKDNPAPPYNITENIAGGAQAIPFRFILLRDAKIKPNDEASYTNLKTLYVVSPRLNKIYIEKRWEFTATPGLKLKKTIDFGEVKLFKLER